MDIFEELVSLRQAIIVAYHNSDYELIDLLDQEIKRLETL